MTQSYIQPTNKDSLRVALLADNGVILDPGEGGAILLRPETEQ